MDVIGEVEVVGVREDTEPEVTCWRVEESLVDENSEIFDTILVGEAIETARGKLEILKDRGRDTCSVLNPSSIYSLLAKPPIALSFSNGVQTISLLPKESL